ncbi:MAG: methyl-accepting chemotaxis protein [Proteobacteria bacterium]|nr:methyl-accepting chemotaxis protein [Pseudomonadota bacterium]
MKTISARLVSALVALFLCTLALAAISISTQWAQETALEKLNAEVIVPLRDLKTISDRYSSDIIDTAHKARSGAVPFDRAQSNVRDGLSEIDSIWSRVAKANHGEQERNVIREIESALGDARRAGEKLGQILGAKDQARLDSFVTKEMYGAIDPATQRVDALAAIKLENGRLIIKNTHEVEQNSLKLLMLVSLVAIMLCIGAISFVVTKVIRPLKRSIATMSALAASTVASSQNGEERLLQLNAISIDGAERKDELGEMARTLVTFKEAGIERQRLRIESEADLAGRHNRADQIEAAITDFERAAMSIVASVATSSTELEASARTMMDIASTASEQSTMVAAASYEAAVTVRSLAETGDQLASSIDEIGRQAEQSSGYASKAAEKAQRAEETVARLTRAGSSIVEVIDLIKSVASQTNLLALNATIEAARAGEAGRGFAVVAAEVKELAGQTSRATDVIAEHVGAIQQASQEATGSMDEIKRMIEEINQVASSIAVAVTEQSMATKGIADNVQQVAQGTTNASEGIAVVSEAATNTGVAADHVLSASAELARQSQAMRDNVDLFLERVRRA